MLPSQMNVILSYIRDVSDFSGWTSEMFLSNGLPAMKGRPCLQGEPH